MDFVQQGRGLKKLYRKIKDCDGYNLRNVMLSLSENEINRICVCVQEYLCGNLNVGNNNMWRILEEDRHINKDLIDFASRRYTIEEKKKFLCNGPGCQGDNVAKLVCCHLLPNFIESIDEEMEVNNKQILRLKRKINKLRKGEDHEESGYDDDDVDEEGEEGDDDEDEEGEEDEQSANDEDEEGEEGEQRENDEDEEGEENIAGKD